MRDDVITPIYDKFLDQANNANQIFLFFKLYFKSYIGGEREEKIVLNFIDSLSKKQSF